MNAGCVSAQIKTTKTETREHNIIIPPLKLVGPDAKKLWEGEIEGKLVAYFRSKKHGGIADIIVVTQDNLPKFFKRVEYLDKNGDGNLDSVIMKTYEIAKGWRDAGIIKDNKYGLGYAGTLYKELLIKIRIAQAKETGK
jgi:hypothetical protein